MAKLVNLFPDGVPITEATRAALTDRRAEAERLRSELLSPYYTSEVMGEASQLQSATPEDLMPSPDEVAWDGNYKVYDDMKRVCLRYAAEQEAAKNVVTSLPLVCLPGVKGDPESERAAEEMQSAWENNDDSGMVLDLIADGFETGFQPMENVWDVHTRGAARDMVAIVGMINRPVSWYGFDYHNNPLFLGSARARMSGKPERVRPHKVTFLRYGSLHTAYGRGTGQYCYPAVWMIHSLLLYQMQMVERHGYIPVIIKYPNTNEYRRDGARYLTLRRSMEQQWKNILMIPDDVENISVTTLTEGAYATANATGAAIREHVKLMEEWMALFLKGVNFSTGNQQEGSFARDASADSRLLYKAPAKAACIEAALNRGFVRPIMLVNRPALEESKWPRFTFDTAPGEDVRMLLSIFDAAAKFEVPISHVTFSEMLKVPLARAGEPVLAKPTAAPQLGFPAQDDTENDPNPLALADKMMSEKSVIVVRGLNGEEFHYEGDCPVYTKNRGIVRASRLTSNDVLVEIPEHDVRSRLRIAH